MTGHSTDRVEQAAPSPTRAPLAETASKTATRRLLGVLGLAVAWAVALDPELVACVQQGGTSGVLAAAVVAAPREWLRGLTARFRAAPAEQGGGGVAESAVFDAVPDALLLVNAGDRVQAANRAVEAVLGYAPDALVGVGLAETLLPARYRDAHRARLRQYAENGRGGTPTSRERLPVVCADGSEIVAELSVRPASNDGPALFGVYIRDVRAARAGEAPLEAAREAAEGRERMLRTVLDALPDAVLGMDRSGRVVFQNQASVRSLRASAGDGAPSGDGAAPAGGSGHPLTVQEWRDADAVMRTGQPVFDQEEPDPAGGVRLTTRIPVRDASGAVAGLVAVSRDVTEQKATEVRLLGDKEAAEAAARANNEFLATTSHEIRTLMSGVTGMTDLLLETTLDDEQRDFVETVRTSSDALLTVINDILDLSKIKAGRLELEDRPFSVRQSVERALSMVTPQGTAKGLDLAYRVDDGVPDDVRGDATRLQQVLVNLLSNAIKFTAEGAVRVHASMASPSPDGHPIVAFAVEDTGIGISSDRLEAVFEPFAQADVSTARTHGGTGLGLAICRRLVEMMGGEMSAESVPGGGSVFRFTVVVRTADAAEATAEAPALSPTLRHLAETPVESGTAESSTSEPAVAEPAPTARPSAAGSPETEAPTAEAPKPERAVVMSMDAILPSARVLLAEDNPVIQKVSMLTLRRLGYRPDVVADGSEAVEAVRRQPYDVVLMDVMMPIMDGLEATRQIRADPGPYPAPAVVAVTANAMEGDRQKCLEAGCDDYLAKPVAPRLLAAVIERSIRLRAGVPVDA